MTEHKDAFAAGRRAGIALVVLCTFWPAMPASADCLSWEDPTAQVSDGVVRAVPGAGAVSYRIAHSYAGFDHHVGVVEVRWTDGGTAIRQVLFHGMHDRPPAALARTREGLAVSLQYCERGAATCRTRTATFVYHRESRSFRGADATARQFISEACRTGE